MHKEEYTVTADDSGRRLDRVLKAHIEGLAQAQVEKLLRKGDIRVGGAKVKSNHRVEEGEVIAYPAFLNEQQKTARPKPTPSSLTKEDIKFIRSLVIKEGPGYWALNKPAGLAVQGGSKTTRHVDHLLPGLVGEGDPRPRLVHRLDKDTSGVLLIAKNAKAAQALGKEFQGKAVEKTYWALVVGVPEILEGRIDMPLAKLEDVSGEKVRVDYDDGQRAVTYYRVVEALGKKLAWLELLPSTGRTHQLRVHCVEGLRTPIVGDGKYGGEEAHPLGRRPMHLHARSLKFKDPSGKTVKVVAEMSEHMIKTWKELGLPDDSDSH